MQDLYTKHTIIWLIFSMCWLNEGICTLHFTNLKHSILYTCSSYLALDTKVMLLPTMKQINGICAWNMDLMPMKGIKKTPAGEISGIYSGNMCLLVKFSLHFAETFQLKKKSTLFQAIPGIKRRYVIANDVEVHSRIHTSPMLHNFRFFRILGVNWHV